MVSGKYIKFLHKAGLTNLKDSEVEMYIKTLKLNLPISKKTRERIHEAKKELYILIGVIISVISFLCFALLGLDSTLGGNFAYRIPVSILLAVVILVSAGLVIFDLFIPERAQKISMSTLSCVFSAFAFSFLLYSLNTDSAYSSLTDYILAIALFVLIIIIAFMGANIALNISRPSQSSAGCFPCEALIDTPSGKRPISQLSIADQVSTYNKITGKVEPYGILKIKTHLESEIWRLSIDGRADIRTTMSHSFLIEGQWKKASNIEIGDVLEIMEDGRAIKLCVTNSRPDNVSAPVFNLVVAGNYNFIVDGAVVHCFTYSRGIRVLFYRLLLVLQMKASKNIKTTNSA